MITEKQNFLWQTPAQRKKKKKNPKVHLKQEKNLRQVISENGWSG